MKPLSPLTCVVVAVVSAAASALVNAVLFGVGATPLMMTGLLALVFLVVAALLVWAGMAVRRLRAHKPTWMTPLLAMRVAVAARASAWVAALCLGICAGDALITGLHVGADAMRAATVSAGLNAVAALVWMVAALVVERWCVIDSDDDDHSEDAHATPA